MASNPENNNDQKTPVYQEDIVTYKIPVGGSLGILALGARGIKAWRKVKKEADIEK